MDGSCPVRDGDGVDDNPRCSSPLLVNVRIADSDWSDDGADSAGAKTRQHGYDDDNDDAYNKYI